MTSGHADYQTVVLLRGMYGGSDISVSVDADGKLRVQRIQVSDLAGYHGDLDGLDANDHPQYLLRALTQALTGTSLYKDGTASYLRVRGGGDENGEGGDIWLYGSTHGTHPGRIALYVPNAAKTSGVCVVAVDGVTDTPVTDWQGRRLTNAADPTNNQDVATKKYVDDNAANYDTRIVWMWRGNIGDLPAGTLICDGNNGTPDLRNRFIVGAGDTYAVGNVGGESTHQLTISEMPEHDHDYYDREWGSWGASGTAVMVHGGTIVRSTLGVGGGNAHENKPPYYALAFFVYS